MSQHMLKSWNDVSIGRKLYLVVGVMAILIAGELIAVGFTMNTLSAVRAFVGGEGAWSKARVFIVLVIITSASLGLALTMLKQSYRELELRVQARTAEMAKAVRAREDFMSIASHELKTPIAALKLQAQLRTRLLQGNAPSAFEIDQVRQMAQSEERQIDRLVRIIDDMLDITRLQRGKFALERVQVDLCAMVRDVLERLHKGECQITSDLRGAVVGHWDSYRLEQVVTNLLVNALKYGAGRPIHVGVAACGDKAELIVKDHGIGIADKDLERIFEQFERAVHGRGIAGLGLGLYIAKQIVVAHGGTISVNSELGVGSQFRVELPVYE